MRQTLVLMSLISALLGARPSAADGTVAHRLIVTLDPPAHTLRVEDTLDLNAVQPDAEGGFRFVLHAGLEPTVATAGWRLERSEEDPSGAFLGINASTGTGDQDVVLESWVLHAPSEAEPVAELHYGGQIHHPLAIQGEEYQRSFSETPGIIGPDGVFLAGASYWVPTFGDGMVTFELETRQLERPWDVVSQGHRVRHLDSTDVGTTIWSCPQPTEEIYLVAGRWHEFADTSGPVEVRVFLRDDEEPLARRYLQATRRYLTMYEGMLTPFPYRSFSLVENFWETGYGMPGFTLLGPRVIRFPWIIASSYPHELLHNWWGNSVYVDLEHGNWCEGLTAYMADHLLAEQRGEGATYRRATLKKFTDLVRGGDDIPLKAFRSRHSGASEAVGYGKSLMLFHMVRRAVGDDGFLAALRRLATSHAFERATFADVAAALADTTGGDWKPFFEQWTGRVGAPRLEIVRAAARATPDQPTPWLVEVVVRQSQVEQPFPVTVPVAVTMEGEGQAVWVEAGSCDRDCTIKIPCSSRPLRLDVDPAFDVMRRLDPLEVPPALSTLFGASEPVFILPSQATAEERAAWQELAAAWARPGQPHTALDTDVAELPDGPVWLLGRDNRLAADLLRRLADHPVERRADAVSVAGSTVPLDGHSLVLVARGAPDPSTAVGWVTADPAAAIPGLARKLPHYTRYSYLAFRGSEPDNVVKGMWAPVGSPLVRNLGDGELAPLSLPERSALAEMPPAYDATSLQATVGALTAAEMGGRGLGSPGLERATSWVERRLSEAGLEPAGTTGFRQAWTWTGGEPPRQMQLTNLVARLPGAGGDEARPVLVTAHLDHLGHGWPDVREENRGRVHPGADDNASGVAVLLEVARALAEEERPARPVLFAVTTGEEAGLLGARHLLEAMDDDNLPMACVNLDTVGRLADGRLYVLRSDTAREWRHIFMGVGYTTGADVAIVAEPLDSSDQEACIARGVPAVQLFTGPHPDYHRPSDTADRIDAAGLATVTEAAQQVVAYLAGRDEPLTTTIDGAATPRSEKADGPRRASLGTMPDFAYKGPGVRVQQVMAGSAAEAAGMTAGDIIIAVDGASVADLRAFSAALKAHAPGDTVAVRVQRDGEQLEIEAVLGRR